MTDEQKKQMQLLHDLRKLSIGLSPEQEELQQELEYKFIADEIMPALGNHVFPLMKQVYGDFTLEVIQTGGRQRAYVERADGYSTQQPSDGGLASGVNEPSDAEPSEEATTSNTKDAYQGPKYFTYQGQRLDDLRPDTRKKKNPRR